MRTCIVALGIILLATSYGFGMTIHVPGDSSTIQAGINGAVDGDTVLVADGIYTGPGNKNLDFKGKAITVRSENGPDSTIIDCENSGRGFRFHSGEGPESVLEGVTIANGYTTNTGGGIYCGASPTLNNCIFSNNYSYFQGGGVQCDGSPTLNNCTFFGNSTNSVGGGLSGVFTSPVITNCTFSGNSAAEHGGGMWFVSAEIALTNCVFSGNSTSGWGGGLRLGDGAYATLTNCTFSDNSAINGGGLHTGWSFTITITNCTFSENAAVDNGGGISCDGPTQLTLENTIIAFSTSGEAVYCGGSSAANLSCCSIYGNDGGDYVGCIEAFAPPRYHNISLDPLFCREENPAEPYTLHSNSPCAPEQTPAFCGLIGAWSVGCGAADLTPPEAIDNLNIAFKRSYKSHDGDICLWWAEPYDSMGVARYVIYRSTTVSSLGDSLTGTMDTIYTDEDAAGDWEVNYFYTVKAVDAAGNKSEESNRVGEFDLRLTRVK